MTQKQFHKKATELIKMLGGIPNEKQEGKYGTMDAYTLQTSLGTLNVMLEQPEPSKVFSIFARFEDVKKARERTDCNEFTGKWNFHTWEAEDCLNLFELKVSDFLIVEKAIP